MARVLNQFRLRMIKKSRLFSYLIYAVGEIILVIAGILIALQINKSQEQKKNRLKVEALMVEIQEDLLEDIEQATTAIQVYEQKDSLINYVLSNTLVEQDYQRNPLLGQIISTYIPYTVNKTGYNNLMMYSDNIPSQFDTVVSVLDQLYINHNKTLEYINDQLSTYVANTFERWAVSYPWFFDQSQMRYNADAANYFLNNPIYKNELVTYKAYAIDNLLNSVRRHRLVASQTYLRINKVLKLIQEPPEAISSFIVELTPAARQRLLGNYSLSPAFSISIFVEHGQLFAQATGQQPFEVFAKSEFELLNPVVGIRFTFHEDDSGEVNEVVLHQHGRSMTFAKTNNE